MRKIGLTFLLLSSLAVCSYAAEFQTPVSEVTVRDLLENAKRTPKSDTYYLMALAAARKNEIEEANKAIATGLSINPRNVRLLNL